MKAAMGEDAAPIILTPQAAESPYFMDVKLNRSGVIVDLSDNSITEGLPLMLGITVSQSVNGVVSPLPNAYVDMGEANAYRIYSDEASQNTTGKTFLRGYQVTDAHGNVHFLTLYPGWYSGRTAHIHCRVRLYSGTTATYFFETQFFFDEAITDKVYSSISPYTTRAAQRDTTNAPDRVYNYADCTTGAVSGNELALVLNANATRAVASYSLILDLTAGGPGSCVGVTDGGINEGSQQGEGGTPPTGAPPTGTPPAGGLPPAA